MRARPTIIASGGLVGAVVLVLGAHHPAGAADVGACLGMPERYKLTSAVRVPYRAFPIYCGNSGYGMRKIAQSHGVRRTGVITDTVRYAPGYSVQDNGRWRFDEVIRKRGTNTRMTFRVVADPPGTGVGVVSAHCVGPSVCPPWVDSDYVLD